MIFSIYKKAYAVLMKKPVRLWGLSLLAGFLGLVATIGFAGVPAIGWAIAWALEVSMANVFLNAYRKGIEPQTNDMFATFAKGRFLRAAGGMAWSALWIVLWSLIPIVGPIFGVIKSYEYCFVPYILMTNEEISATDALKLSKQQTMGFKSKMFWAEILVCVLYIAANLVLSLFAAIPYIGILFAIVSFVLSIAYALLSPLFFGIVRAAFFVEATAPAIEAAAE